MNEVQVFYDMPYREYEQIDAVRHSDLLNMLKSPKHYQYGRVAERTDTPSMMLGRALHTKVLQPELFAKEFAVEPKLDKRTKEGKILAEEFAALAVNKEIVSQDADVASSEMVDAIMANGMAKYLIAGIEHAEVSMLAEINGIKVKARLDGVGNGYLIDVKTAADGSREAFGRAIDNFGYHLQMALYTQMWTHATGELITPAFVVVENSKPYAVGTYVMDTETMAVGRGLCQDAILRIAEFENRSQLGSNMDYTDGLAVVSIPGWAFKKYQGGCLDV